MKYEKTQKGNPHQLTIHQHCFPKKSIERFCDENGVVRVHLIREHKSVLLKPEHPIFCARRVWDQRAESVFMQSIENRYQDLASKLVTGGAAHWLSIAENQVVTDMYSLWHVRCCWKNQHLENQELIGILAPSEDYCKDQRESLEKHNLWTHVYEGCGASVHIPGHHIAGFLVQNDWGRVRNALRNCHWGILESDSGEFIVPDISRAGLALPVTPTMWLMKGEGHRIVSKPELHQINEYVKLHSEKYYFKRPI